MDRSTCRSCDDFTTETPLIDVTDISPAMLDDLPDVALSRALRRALREGVDGVESFANFLDGPPPHD